MKKIEYNHNKIEGPDTCIEISLKEYGFAWIEGENNILILSKILNNKQGVY